MQVTTKKLIRGTIFTVAMGIVSLVAIVEGGFNAAFIAGLYIFGALLVFGVDIRRIEWGQLTIKFESDRLPAVDGGNGEHDNGQADSDGGE